MNNENTVMNSTMLSRKWMVLFVAVLANFCSIGLIVSLSVLYVEWLEAFGESAAKTSLVQSICNGIFAISGLILGVLLSRFGVQMIGMVSGVVLSLGFILSFFAPNLIYLIFVLSISVGFGSAGLYLTSMTAVQQYFDGKQKHASLSIASVGSGVGGTVFTYLINYLSLQYGWKGGMLIVGGMLLHIVPLFAICRPINKQTPSNADGKTTAGTKHRLTKLLRDFKIIIRTRLFLVNLLAIIILPAMAATLIIMIDFLQEKGFSREDAVLFYMVLTICASISRLAPAFFKCIPHLSIFGIALLTSVLGTATLLAMPSIHSFFWNIVGMCCIGFCYGATAGGILPVSVSKTVSQQHFPQAIGITLTGFGTILVSIGPFHGYLRDITGSYDAVFYASGSYGCLSILMYTIALRLNLKLKTKTFDDRDQSEGIRKKNTSIISDDRKRSKEQNILATSDDGTRFAEENTSTDSNKGKVLEKKSTFSNSNDRKRYGEELSTNINNGNKCKEEDTSSNSDDGKQSRGDNMFTNSDDEKQYEKENTSTNSDKGKQYEKVNSFSNSNDRNVYGEENTSTKWDDRKRSKEQNTFTKSVIGKHSREDNMSTKSDIEKKSGEQNMFSNFDVGKRSEEQNISTHIDDRKQENKYTYENVTHNLYQCNITVETRL